VAAIDCGTNSTRLLVAGEDGRPLERLMRITRLGEGVDASGKLSADAIERTTAVLSEYRRVMDRFGVVQGRLAATSAVRDASNGGDFLVPAQRIAGFAAEVLDGTEEGRLSLAGAVADLDPDEGPFLVLDIGGGSTELVAGVGPTDPELEVVSLQLGCVRLTERYLLSDPPHDDELRRAEAAIAASLEEAVTRYPRLTGARRLVGLAGTVTTLASLDLGLATYDRDEVHHAVLTANAAAHWCRTLAAEDRPARLGRAGMVRGREDVIVAGAMILTVVMGRFGFDRCLVSESDILDGLVASLLAAS
jgi:exopolyphosphatase / guanosine-5'-triphosphate,3'-diphosphate pyrophosphatase